MTDANVSKPDASPSPTPAPRDPTRWLLDCLDSVAGLARVPTSSSGDPLTVEQALETVLPVLRRLDVFRAMAFLLVDEEGQDFDLVTCEPADAGAALQRETDAQIAAGTFSWALYQNRPIVVPALELDHAVLWHVIGTRSRTIGMFMGWVDPSQEFVPDAVQKLVSVALMFCGNTIESAALYRSLHAQNRQLEEKVAERTAQLRAASDRALAASQAKSEFLATMTHEVRTPLTSILGFAALLADGTLDEEQREYVQRIRSSGALMLRIVNDVLDMAKIESGKLDIEHIEMKPGALLKTVQDLFADAARAKGVELVCVADPSLPETVLSDPYRLGQILANLVGNAVKFTDNGRVAVEVACNPVPEGPLQIECRVTDTGIGIEPAKLQRLFQAFSQADGSTTRRFGGTGLGLSISKKLVDRMGGRIGVESRPGQGSCFWFAVPVDVSS